MSGPEPSLEPLTGDERAELAAVLGVLIPADEARGIPGADAVVLDGLCDDRAQIVTIRGGLSLLWGWVGGRFADEPVARRVELLARLEREQVLLFRALLKAVVSRYYVDDRVLRAIGVEPRPPFPDGYRVEDGDLLLLESVYERGPICRPVVPPTS